MGFVAKNEVHVFVPAPWCESDDKVTPMKGEQKEQKEIISPKRAPADLYKRVTNLISKVISSKSKKESDLQTLFPREQHRRRELKYLQELSECLLLVEKTWSCERNE